MGLAVTLCDQLCGAAADASSVVVPAACRSDSQLWVCEESVFDCEKDR